jgi:hypothetical protein
MRRGGTIRVLPTGFKQTEYRGYDIISREQDSSFIYDTIPFFTIPSGYYPVQTVDGWVIRKQFESNNMVLTDLPPEMIQYVDKYLDDSDSTLFSASNSNLRADIRQRLSPMLRLENTVTAVQNSLGNVVMNYEINFDRENRQTYASININDTPLSLNIVLNRYGDWGWHLGYDYNPQSVVWLLGVTNDNSTNGIVPVITHRITQHLIARIAGKAGKNAF